MGLDPATLSPAFRAKMQVTHPPGKDPQYRLPGNGTVTTKKGKAQRMNKTEARLKMELESMDASGFPTGYDYRAFTRVRFEAITLYLANDCRYTPDFYCEGQLKPIFFECKGAKVWEDSFIKFKTAVELFPSFSFYFAQWKGSVWHITKYS